VQSEKLNAEARARVGQVLNDKWTLERLVGVGGMAAVYGARHRNGARAAVKLLHGELGRNPAVRERFLREGYAANRVEHRGAVQVLDDDVVHGGPDDGAAYIVMELLEGESLEDRAAHPPPLGEQEYLAILDGVLDVLEAAHEHGVVHRDLKPDNIFLARDPDSGKLRVKVLDFGLARLTESASTTQFGLALGTPSYMSPEQAAGRAGEIDGRTDLFALGATGFRLLALRRIHEEENVVRLVTLMANEPAPAIRSVAPNVSERVAAIIDRALAFDREDRYPTAAAMRADVQAARDPSEPESVGLAAAKSVTSKATAESTIALSATDLDASSSASEAGDGEPTHATELAKAFPPDVVAEVPPLFAGEPALASALPPSTELRAAIAMEAALQAALLPEPPAAPAPASKATRTAKAAETAKAAKAAETAETAETAKAAEAAKTAETAATAEAAKTAKAAETAKAAKAAKEPEIATARTAPKLPPSKAVQPPESEPATLPLPRPTRPQPAQLAEASDSVDAAPERESAPARRRSLIPFLTVAFYVVLIVAYRLTSNDEREAAGGAVAPSPDAASASRDAESDAALALAQATDVPASLLELDADADDDAEDTSAEAEAEAWPSTDADSSANEEADAEAFEAQEREVREAILDAQPLPSPARTAAPVPRPAATPPPRRIPPPPKKVPAHIPPRKPR
jgi:serine/threonine-protein kinase